MARTVRTKGGKTLTAADIDRLANEAEQGFDLSHWRPRRGRPSLSTTAAGRSPRVGARVPDDLYRRATERAAAEGKSISEVLRDLLAAYADGRELAGPRRRRSNRPRNCRDLFGISRSEHSAQAEALDMQEVAGSSPGSRTRQPRERPRRAD